MNRTLTRLSYTLLSIGLLLLAGGCSLFPSLSHSGSGGTLSFQVKGAVAVVGSSGTGSRTMVGRAVSSSELEKVLTDGSLTSALSVSGGDSTWKPTVSFIGTGSDKSVYVCFTKVYSVADAKGNSKFVQFVRVYPDNHYDIIWPLDSMNGTTTTPPVVQSWSWPGADSNSMMTGPGGKIYFITTDSSATQPTPVDTLYVYDPATGGQPVAVTSAASTDRAISKFAIDSGGDVFVSGGNQENTTAWFRAYIPGQTTPITIFSTTDPVALTAPQLNSFTADPSSSSVIFSGRNIAGMTGIGRATVDSSGHLSYDLLYGNPEGGSAYIDLVQTPEKDNPTALIDQDASGSTYSWDPSVLTNGAPDKTKILSRVQAYYYTASSPVTLTDSSLLTADINAGAASSIAMQIETNPKTFLTTYFSGTFFADYLTSQNLPSLNFDYLGQFFWDSTGALYASYCPQWWNASVSTEPGRLLRLLDSSGAIRLSAVALNHGQDSPTKVKYVDGSVYYVYSVTSGGAATGAQGIDRLNLATGSSSEESLLTDSSLTSLAPSGIAIGDYDVSSDGTALYLSGTNLATNAPIFGKLDLSTKTFTPMSSGATFNRVGAL